MKNKKIIFGLIIIFIILIIIIIFKIVIKNSINGNNMDSQEIVEYILNINSYLAKVEIEVNSNKNTNKYILLQEYNTENGCVQEVLEPSNIAGVKITNKDGNIYIENTNLNLSTIFENYQGLEENSLDLSNFINDYKNNFNSTFYEKEDKIIMETFQEDNKYLRNEELYIDKGKKIPTELIIKDNDQNTTIIIKYNEIELN